MEFLILLFFMILMCIVLKVVFQIDMKKLKKVGEDKNLDNIISRYPSNIELCKEYLKRLNNEDVNVIEDKEANTTMYLIMGNKILIANLQNSFTRIQTIAHECLHSVQSKKVLWFNFIFSNIYLAFFIIVSMLAIFKILPYKIMFLAILVLMGLIYYVVRAYLENDAMIKARFLAKDYMEDKGISDQKEIEKIVNRLDELNDIGIKCVNFNLFTSTVIKNIIFCLICIVR